MAASYAKPEYIYYNPALSRYEPRAEIVMMDLSTPSKGPRPTPVVWPTGTLQVAEGRRRPDFFGQALPAATSTRRMYSSKCFHAFESESFRPFFRERRDL